MKNRMSNLIKPIVCKGTKNTRSSIFMCAFHGIKISIEYFIAKGFK